jgi:hypothetical protein
MGRGLGDQVYAVEVYTLRCETPANFLGPMLQRFEVTALDGKDALNKGSTTVLTSPPVPACFVVVFNAQSRRRVTRDWTRATTFTCLGCGLSSVSWHGVTTAGLLAMVAILGAEAAATKRRRPARRARRSGWGSQKQGS